MKKWTQLDACAAPGGTKLTLHEHDGEYAIRVNGRELMSTRRHASEERLAQVGCAHLRTRSKARVLIGGLGFGYTLRTALVNLAPDAEVVVAELLEGVVAWNRNRSYPLAADALADPRTRLEMRDVAELVADGSGAYDSIMLDADNNTTAMSTPGNRSFYEREGLALVMAALRPSGRVVYWSADSDPRLAKLMGKSGFKVEVERASAFGTSNARHTLLIGRR